MDAKSQPFDPAAHGWETYAAEGFVSLVGPFWMKKDGDRYRYGFLAEPKHHNRRGVVQGGMIMTFADRSMGMTAWYANDKKPQATVHLDVHFVDAVQIGEFVEATCRVVRRTHRRRARGRDRQRRVEGAREGLSGQPRRARSCYRSGIAFN